jgi:UTP--glucose-1-phosphate uridylyltransferase
MPLPVRKAVFPVAGFGTRFLPATKAMPKEMLTIVDRPLIQYAVDEARAAGIEHCIFVTGRNKTIVEDHFDQAFELEETLRARGRKEALAELARDMLPAGKSSFTRQQAAHGLGHAVWCARDIVGDEPFAVLLPDMLMQAEPNCLAQMMDVYRQTGGNVISVEECDPALTRQYGIVGVGEPAGGDSFRITSMVEKPEPKAAPSNLFINGRYILQPGIFRQLDRQERGAGNEVQLTDAMIAAAKSDPFYGVRFRGRSFDCGSKIGFLKANVALGLDRADLGQEFADAARALLAEKG